MLKNINVDLIINSLHLKILKKKYHLCISFCRLKRENIVREIILFNIIDDIINGSTYIVYKVFHD